MAMRFGSTARERQLHAKPSIRSRSLFAASRNSTSAISIQKRGRLNVSASELAFPKVRRRARNTRTAEERAEKKRLDSFLEEVRRGPCQACGRKSRCDVEHIKTRGSGGPDEQWNIWSACRLCHIEKGSKGVAHMAEKYWRFRFVLLSKGWRIDEFAGKWTYKNGSDSG